MDPCLLAETGVSQTVVLLASVLIIAATFAMFWFGRNNYRYNYKRGVFSAAVLLFGLAVVVSPAGTVYAQSIEDCPPETSQTDNSSGDNGDNTPQVLALVDDQVTMQFPSDDSWQTATTYAYYAVLANDSAPTDDPLDWDTVDLDPNTPGLQRSLSFQHPNAPSDEDCEIAEIQVGVFGVLDITMNYSCGYLIDEENSIYETHIIPNDYQIPSFTYTAQTQSGQPAPVPALVTILAEPSPSSGVVIANNDQWQCTHSSSPWYGSLPDNDTTTVGTINPSTVDLNPSLPGLQQSVVATSNMGSTYQLSVDSAGEFTIDVINMVAGDTAVDFTAFYTIQNTAGTVSNIATIKVGNCPT